MHFGGTNYIIADYKQDWSWLKGAYWISSNSSFIQDCDSNIGFFSRPFQIRTQSGDKFIQKFYFRITFDSVLMCIKISEVIIFLCVGWFIKYQILLHSKTVLSSYATSSYISKTICTFNLSKMYIVWNIVCKLLSLY